MLLDRKTAPQVGELSSFTITRALSSKLSNGIPVYSIKSGNQEMVKLEIMFNAGNYFEAQPALAFLTSRMLNEGTQKHSAREIAEKIAGFGAFWEIVPGQDTMLLSLLALNKHLPYLLPLVYDIVHNAAFPEANFENIKHIHSQQLKINLEKTSFVATGLFKQNIFGVQHPYGYFISEENINQTTLADCVAFYNTKIKDNTFEILVSGMVTESILKDIDAVFGKDKIKFPPLAGTIKKEVKAEGQNVVHKEKEGSLQASVRIGRRLFTRNHPDYLKFTVLNEVLGGYFGSRLMKNLREDKGYTYGVHSHVVSMASEGYCMIRADVKKEHAADAVNEIYKEIELLKTELIGEEELQTVKNYMMGSFLGSVTTPFALADKFKALHASKLTYDFYDKYIDTIKKISAKDLVQLANKYLDKDNLSEIVVG